MSRIAAERPAPDRTGGGPRGAVDQVPPPGGPPLVFLVDDDALLRHLVGDWIEAAGYRTLRLPDGASCLSALARQRPDAVILDLHMAGPAPPARESFRRALAPME